MYVFPEELRRAYEAMPTALVYDQYLDGKVVPLLVSDGFCKLVGMERAVVMDWFSESQFERLHPDDVGRVVRVSMDFANKLCGYDLIFRVRHPDGYHVLHAVGQWQTMPDGTELALLTYSDLSESMDAMGDSLEHYTQFRADQFFTDPLTGLPNQNYLNQFASERIHSLRALGQTPMLLFADIVSLRYYNSRFGYQQGNELLQRTAEALKEAFPEALVVRSADDHFILIDAYESRERTAEQVEAANGRIRRETEGNTAGIKAGVYVYDELLNTAEAIDRARNANKWIGADLTRVCHFYDDDTDDSYRARRYIIENLDTALRERWIQVFYQPIIRAANGKICDSESLARWIDPEKGMLRPADFIPYLEDSGQIWKLDLYVVDQILDRMKRNVEAGGKLIPHSVNLSRADFTACDIVEEIRKRVDAAGVPRECIAIEITESIIGSDFEHMKEQAERLRSLGFQVWLDDFGSGYSSLDALQSIPFNVIKFDMSFMKKLDESERSKIVLTEMMKLAAFLGAETLCEGVETEAQVQFLREIGCSKLQGFYFAPPVSPDALRERHRSGLKIGYENPEEVPYYEAIGKVNLYDLAAISSEDTDAFRNLFNTLPMGILEVRGGQSRFVRSNQSYRDFLKRFFGFDLSNDGTEFLPYDDAFMNNVVKTCCEQASRSFFDQKMPNGTTVHSLARRIAVNPLDGTVAIAVAVLSITDTDEAVTYAGIAQALAADYYNLYCVDLDTNDFIEYSSRIGGEELSVERRGGDFFEAARRDTLTRIYEEDREPFLKWFTKENILRELDAQGVFTTTYRLIGEAGPVYVNMKITRMQGGNRIILGISNIDAQMKLQEEDKKLRQERVSLGRIASLAPDYIVLYTVDPVTGQYTQFSPSREFARFGLARQGEDFFRDVELDAPKAIDPADMERHLRVFTKNNILREIRKNGMFIHNYRLLLDGKSVPVSLKATLIEEADGQKILLGVANDDREELRRRLETAYEKERDNSIIFTHIAEALARGCTDLYYVNMETDELIEYHTDDVLGVLTEARRGADFFEGCERDVKLFVHPEDQEIFVRTMNRDFLAEALETSNIYEFIYRRIKGGRTFYVKMRVSRVKDDPRFIVIAVSDVDEQVKQRRMEERLIEERVIYARLHAITGNYIVVYVVDPATGHYREFSAKDDYGDFAQEKEGADFFRTLRDAIAVFSHPDDRERVISRLTKDNVMAEIERSGIYTLGYRLASDGGYVYVQLKAALVEEAEGLRLIVGLVDIDAQVRQEEEFGRRLAQAQTQASIDALTGVKNRHAYLLAEARMNRQIEARRQAPFAIVMLDVNDLKKINDTAGHQAGDQYLCNARKIVCDIFKHSPVYRIGGDEFAVIAQGEDYENIDRRIGELKAHNEKALRSDGVTIACGMARFADDTCVAQVFERADHSMYEDKLALKSRRAT